MSKIQVMSEDLANKISAGEVVEKTMNIVKELTENALDAGSNEIKIDLIDSGIREITVSDNGSGMDREDAEKAFFRHATSKLKSLEDLFYVNTLGFRGEALPSIAAVSNVVLKTSNGEVGTEIIIDGGEIKSIRDSDLKKGTKISVKNLFYNTPVRLKYLKNPYVELSNITDFVNKMALAFPNVRFLLTNNEKVLLNTDGSNNLLKVISSVYGVEVAKKMLAIKNESDDYSISGYIGYPEIARTSKNNIVILVNGRVIKNYEVNRIIVESYHTYIPDSKYPIVVINIEVDPILIDVNVHPTKMDIKFSKIDTLKDLLTTTIKEKLSEINLIPKITIKEVVEVDTYQSEELLFDYDTVKEEKEHYSITKEDTINEELKETLANSNEKIKKMFPVGVVHATYIVAENEDGMYLIDQHAAAERINYEKYLDKLTEDKKQKIDLLIPIKIELQNKDYITLKENFNKLEDVGFEIEEFGINTIVIRSHPYWLPENNEEEAIRNIIDIILISEDFDKGKFIDHIAATVACKASIKANDHITHTDMEDLLDRLRKTKNPFTCPHGRPTIIAFSTYELEKLFKRVMN